MHKPAAAVGIHTEVVGKTGGHRRIEDIHRLPAVKDATMRFQWSRECNREIYSIVQVELRFLLDANLQSSKHPRRRELTL